MTTLRIVRIMNIADEGFIIEHFAGSIIVIRFHQDVPHNDFGIALFDQRGRRIEIMKVIMDRSMYFRVNSDRGRNCSRRE